MNKKQIEKIIKTIETKPTKLEYCVVYLSIVKLLLNRAFRKVKLLLDKKYTQIKNFNNLHGE